MQDFNNFSTLMHVEAKSFEAFKEKLMAISIPCKVELYGKNPNGSFYAIVQCDRPVRSKGKEKD